MKEVRQYQKRLSWHRTFGEWISRFSDWCHDIGTWLEEKNMPPSHLEAALRLGKKLCPEGWAVEAHEPLWTDGWIVLAFRRDSQYFWVDVNLESGMAWYPEIPCHSDDGLPDQGDLYTTTIDWLDVPRLMQNVVTDLHNSD